MTKARITLEWIPSSTGSRNCRGRQRSSAGWSEKKAEITQRNLGEQQEVQQQAAKKPVMKH